MSSMSKWVCISEELCFTNTERMHAPSLRTGGRSRLCANPGPRPQHRAQPMASPRTRQALWRERRQLGKG